MTFHSKHILVFIIVVALIGVGAILLSYKQGQKNYLPIGQYTGVPKEVVVKTPGGNPPIPDSPDDDVEEIDQLLTAWPRLADDPRDYSEYYVSTIKDPGVTWLNTPERLGDLHLFMLNPDFEPAQNDKDYEIGFHAYYKIGEDNGKAIIISGKPVWGMTGDGGLLVFREETNGTYSLITNNGTDLEYLADDLAPSPKIVIDEKTKYESLDAPETISFAGETLKEYRGLGGYYFFSTQIEDLGTTYIGQTRYGPLFETRQAASRGETEWNYLLSRFLLRLPGGLVQTYDVDDTSLDETIVWNDGTKNEDEYTHEGLHGCGSFGNSVIADPAKVWDSDLTVAGRAANGVEILEFVSSSHPTFLDFANAAGGFRYEYDVETKQSEKVAFTIEEYMNMHGLILYQDGFGRLVLMKNNKYGPVAECGKPVIYLYPEDRAEVSIRVGADISVSEPQYENGWNVIAEPNGTLSIEGEVYDSLFWEGTGQGSYPEIMTGFVVKGELIEKTLRDHMTQLGLNSKEQNDFLEFWLPRMPDTPYIRLSWLGTQEMNALAPLSITPHPDTLIRIFLDLEGREQFESLPSQVLRAPERIGFTVVEWGGLLIH